MEWWSVFYKVRRAVFGFIAVSSLLWGIFLSVYLSRMWTHLLPAQRIIMLSIIGANGFTALLLYLMAVVVFRVWKDLARVVFLLLIHIACAVMLTLFGSNFSCDTMKTETACKHVDLAFVVGSWVMTGLLLGYIPYLLIMLRVPRPTPKLSSSPLLATPPVSRRSSTSSFGSVTSTTGLLRAGTTQSLYTTRTFPKKLFLVDNSVTSAVPTEPWQSIRNGGNYGTIDPSRDPLAPASPVSIYPDTPRFQPPPPAPILYTIPPVPFGVTQHAVSRPLPEPPLSNPFADPLSRMTTPIARFSQYTFTSTNVSTNHPVAEQYSPVAPFKLNIPTIPSISSVSTPVPTASTPQPVFSPYEGKWIHPSDSVRRTSRLQAEVGPMLRQHTATPHSIHSVAPSMHLYDGYSQSPPAPIHARASSDPIWRPHTAAPTTYIDPDAPLPNPFPMVSSADVRRFESVPSAQFYTGQGGTYRHARNASHLAGALGRTPPRVEAAVMDREQWKQLVFTAATGRKL